VIRDRPGSARNVKLDDDLLRRIHAAVQPGDEILTLTTKRPNVIAAIGQDGIWVETLRSKRRQSGPRLVPAWMIVTAWRHLRKNGVLTHAELLDDLNVKRSAFVVALLAKFNDVAVSSTHPIVIELIGAQS
jgi:hypothetical protein